MRAQNRGGSSDIRSTDYLDRGHHPLVIVGQQVAMVHELADHHRIGERNDDLDLSPHRHIHGVVVTVQWLRHAIHLHELKPGLVNVEVVQRPALSRPAPSTLARPSTSMKTGTESRCATL